MSKVKTVEEIFKKYKLSYFIQGHGNKDLIPKDRFIKALAELASQFKGTEEEVLKKYPRHQWSEGNGFYYRESDVKEIIRALSYKPKEGFPTMCGQELLLDLIAEFCQPSKQQEGWISVKNLPTTGTKVIAELQHWESKNLRYFELIKVNEDDCPWRTADDNSEVSYDWNVIRYMPLPQQPITKEQ